MEFKINILPILLVFVLLFSCTNLEETLYTQVNSNDYGNTPAEVETIVGGAYTSLRGFRDELSNSYPTSEYVFFLNEVASDEATIPTRGTDWFDGGNYQEAQRIL
jgi:hypothetical protein